MYINHLAIWVSDLEKMKSFYERYLGATAGDRYHNPNKQFYAYFLSFAHGCRLELMYQENIAPIEKKNDQHLGIIHFAVSTGSKEEVDRLTRLLRDDGYTIAGEPRTTGDGYYESVVLDPEGNRIEITV